MDENNPNRPSVRDLPRILGVLGFHALRALGARDRDRTALLAKAGHEVACGWLVRRIDRQPFDIRRAAQDDEVAVTPRHWPHRQRSPTLGDRYLLLAGGHVRNVVVLRHSPGSAITLRIGVERAAMPLPGQEVIAGLTPPTDPTHVAMAVYSELGSQIRTLTDVRFKLLALVPTISSLALTAIVSPSGPLENASTAVRVGAALIGFLVVAMVRMYDVRNSELYDDLISRARSLEAGLGVERGVFNRRRSSVWPIEHDRALRWLYWVVLAAWLAAAFVAVADSL